MSETPSLSFAQLGGLGNGGWREALRIAQRQAPLLGEGLGKLSWGLPAEAGSARGVLSSVRACSQHEAAVFQGREQRFNPQLILQTTVEALNSRMFRPSSLAT